MSYDGRAVLGGRASLNEGRAILRVTTMSRVRLTHKFASFIAGVDLRHLKAGASLSVTPSQALELIHGGWAIRENSRSSAKTGTNKVIAKRGRGARKRAG